VIFIVVLLHERDRRVLIPHPHRQRRAVRADGKGLITELSCQVKGLPQRLLLRQAQRVLGDLRLDAGSHLTCRPEVPVGRCQALEPLVRPLEVVVLQVQRHAALAVLEVGEHRAAEQLLPQRLPEPLDLPASLWMVRAALHMLDAVTLQLRLELRAATPGGVLPALVGQDLPRRPVVGNASRQRLQHQHAPLVMRHRQTHQIPGVIIEERRHIDPLVTAQQEREQVRLPQLVGLGALEVLHLHLPAYPTLGHQGLDAFGPQHSPHRRLGSADPQKPAHHIADAAAAGCRRPCLRRQDRLRTLIRWPLQVRMQRGLAHFERCLATLPVRLHPLRRGRVRHAQLLGHSVRRLASIDHRPHHRHSYILRPRPTSFASPRVLVPRFARLAFCLHLSSPSLLLAQQRARQVLGDYAIIPSRIRWFAAHPQ
jgi:hypothetical protein